MALKEKTDENVIKIKKNIFFFDQTLAYCRNFSKI